MNTIAKKNREQISFYLLILLMIVLSLLMFAQAFFGVASRDEAYYIADAHTVLQGNLPYVDNTCYATGMVFLMLPFLAVYEWLIPSLEGVFLYMRLCFVVFRLAIILLSVFLLRKRYSRNSLCIAACLMIVWFGSVIQNFSYNTISVYLFFLTGVLLTVALDSENLCTICISSFIAGILVAFAEFSHPAQALGVLFFGAALIFLNKKGMRLASCGCYLMGGASTAIGVLAFLGYIGGFQRLLYGLKSMVVYEPTILLDASANLASLIPLLILWLLMLLMTLFVAVLQLVYYRKHPRPQSVTAKNVVSFGAVSSFLCALLGYVFIQAAPHQLVKLIGGNAFMLAILCGFLIKDRLFTFIVFPPVLFTVSEILLTFSDCSDRFFYMLPAIFALYLCLHSLPGQTKLCKLLLSICVLICSLLTLKSDFLFLYREDPISQLTCQIDSGVFRGLYTSPEKASDSIELEQYLNSITEPGEEILFRDTVPVAYLMSNGRICDIRTWDHLQYPVGDNNPTVMYRYFTNRQQIPDKIIYVDNQTAPQLSIEDSTYRFNDFVNTFYQLTSEETLNSSYRVQVYTNIGAQYSDFAQWIQGTDFRDDV